MDIANLDSRTSGTARQENRTISNGEVPVDRLLPMSDVGGPIRRLPRRRAATACQLCRARKTKCDNNRPSCGYCIFQGARCVYSDSLSGARPGSPRSPSRPVPHEDVSNAVVLERINNLTTLVEALRGGSAAGGSPQTPYPVAATPGQLTVPISAFGGPDQSPSVINNAEKDATPGSAFTNDGFGKLNVSELAARTSACESILKWPALRDVYWNERITSFPLQSVVGSETENEAPSTNTGRVPIQEDNIWPLCRKFLALIHIKNPILNVSQFKQYAREAAECGPSWDGRGCLVLLACALACCASPYHPVRDRYPSERAGESPLVATPTADSSSSGEAYFAAAMRRLGLLPNSLLSIQCHYFAGLYEKFSIRPLPAWTLLQQACVRFQAYLYAKALSAPLDSDLAKSSRHIEQRLYWSCVKAECELRTDLQLPESGLLKFKYPDLFPSLSFPENLSSADGFAGSAGQSPTFQVGSTSTSERCLAPEEERSWLYYLAEISLRKIMNRILEDLYSKGEQYWITDITVTIQQHAAYSEELALWRAHLPHQIKFSDAEMPDNELAFFLKTRYLGCLEWISRPFLFYSITVAIFRPDPTVDSSSAVQLQVVTLLAQQCVDVCEQLIAIVSRHHRHGGIWALLRRSFGAALLLLAAAVSVTGVERRESPGLVTISLQPSDDWQGSVGLAIATIRKWENGVADLCWMRQVLERLLEATLAVT